MPTGPIRIRSGRLPADSEGHTPPAFTPYFSVLGMSEADTPMVIPIRAHLDTIERLIIGDYYIGRGSRQRGLSKSIFCITHKVSAVGRESCDPTVRETCRETAVWMKGYGLFQACV